MHRSNVENEGEKEREAKQLLEESLTEKECQLEDP